MLLLDLTVLCLPMHSTGAGCDRKECGGLIREGEFRAPGDVIVETEGPLPSVNTDFSVLDDILQLETGVSSAACF